MTLDITQRTVLWAMTDGCVGFNQFGRKMQEFMRCETCAHFDYPCCRNTEAPLCNSPIADTPKWDGTWGCGMWRWNGVDNNKAG